MAGLIKSIRDVLSELLFLLKTSLFTLISDFASQLHSRTAFQDLTVTLTHLVMFGKSQ